MSKRRKGNEARYLGKKGLRKARNRRAVRRERNKKKTEPNEEVIWAH